MRTATLQMPDETSRAVDSLLDRLRREAGSAPGRFDFLSAVFARTLPAENDRSDALAAAADQTAQEAREKAKTAKQPAADAA